MRSLSEVIEVIMNRRLKSNEVLKKFGNMHRILENILTYYYEKFLNIHEREAVAN